MHKPLRLLLILCLLLLCCSPAAQASVLGERIDGYDAVMGGNVRLSRGVYWTGNDYRTENYLTYSGERNVFPVVVYGSKVLNYGDFPSMAALLEQRGYTVLGGINGDYYHTANFQPLGIVVSQGRLLSSDGGHWAIGFRADGSAVISKPALYMTLNIAGADYGLGAVNKARGSEHFALFTEDHSYTTQAKTMGRNAVLSIAEGGELTTSCRLTLRVEEIIATDQPLELKPGQLILSLDSAAPAARQAGMDALYPGAALTLSISCAPGWEQMEYAVGCLYKLLSNGQAEAGLDNTLAPRTAVGVKPGGELVLYTVDGRQSGHSQGAGMTQVAQRLLELGCVEAGLLDGGGSTSLNAMYGGAAGVTQINRPSDGSQRSVSNYIMLVSAASAGGEAKSLALHPLSLNILSGAAARFTAFAMDVNGLAARIPSRLEYSVDSALGSVDQNGLFRAAGSGSGWLTLSSAGLKPASVPVRVIDLPDAVRILDQATGQAVTRLDILAGESVDLSAAAEYNHLKLIADDTCFSWLVIGNIGSVDEQGLFIAADIRGEGQIIANAGAASFVLPVTVKRDYTFDDVPPAHWGYAAVEYVAGRGLFTGLGENTFAPGSSMNRAMLVTVLHRVAGRPAGGSHSFSDVAPGEWYSEAVAWAAANGVVAGLGDGSFGPGRDVTREQIASILCRYAAAGSGDMTLTADLAAFPDAALVHDWAADGMRWAVAAGIISGRTDGSLDPLGAASRAEVAAMLMRFLERP